MRVDLLKKISGTEGSGRKQEHSNGLTSREQIYSRRLAEQKYLGVTRTAIEQACVRRTAQKA